MSHMQQGGAGTISTGVLLDYVRPELVDTSIPKRPDVIHGPTSTSGSQQSLLYTIVIIILSALIFITFVAFADVIRTAYDSKLLPSTPEGLLLSRTYLACTFLFVTILVLILLFLARKWLTKSDSKNSNLMRK